MLLGSFFVGNAVATLTGARAFLDPLAALICVAAIEGAVRVRRGLLGQRERLLLELIDMARIGFSYGLMVEAFKLL